MPSTSVTLIPTTTFGSASGNYDGNATGFNSIEAKGDGYYGYTDGLHTCAYYPAALVGSIKMQGTLVLNPTEADWFDITGTTLTAGSPTSTAVTYNFTGNFVWLRAVVFDFTAGSISRVQMNF